MTVRQSSRNRSDLGSGKSVTTDFSAERQKRLASACIESYVSE